MKENFREECYVLPISELRKKYLKLLKLQKTVAYLLVIQIFPMAICYGIMGWTSFLGSLYVQFGFFDTSVTGFVDFLGLAVCGVLLTSKNEKFFKFIPVIYFVVLALKYLIFDSFSIISALILCLLIVTSFAVRKIVLDLNLLRNLPSFPFLDLQYNNNFEEMTREKMSEYLKHVQNGGIYSTDYERIFDSDNPEEIVSPKDTTEEYFQQNKLLHKNKK